MGARFEALDELVFMAPLDLRCIFFTTQTVPFELCVNGSSIFGQIHLFRNTAQIVFGLKICYEKIVVTCETACH